MFGYIRVSTAKQGELGVSLQEQRSAIEAYVARHNMEITDWLEERVTAAKRGRPAFTRMLKRLRKGEADGVVIHKIDRGARNLKDWADLGELIDHGIDVHFVTESLDLHSNAGRLSADVQAVVAAHYIRNLREETLKGFYGRLRQGLYPLRAPIGYLDRGKGQAKVPDPEAAPLVRHAFEIYATGQYNFDSLLAELDLLGLRNKHGGRLSRNGLSTILNNTFYTGLIRLKRTGETFTGKHQPLVSVALFQRVQAVLEGRANEWVNRHDFLFRRLLLCLNCRYSLIGERQKGKIYYRCHTKRCPTTGVREEAVEAAIERVLSPAELGDMEMSILLEQLDALRARWQADHAARLGSLRLNRDRLRQRLNRLTDVYVEGNLEKEIFEERRGVLLMEERALEERIKETEQNPFAPIERVTKFLEQANHLCSSYLSALPDEKRDFLREATSNRSVDGKNVAIELHSPYSELASRPKMHECDRQRDEPRTFDPILVLLVRYFT